MRFGDPLRPRRPKEAVVPMINVVFLLLIFFLMTAVVSPPPPFDLTLPDGALEGGTDVGDTLYIGPDGDLAYETLRGSAVYDALAGRSHDKPLNIWADQGVSAAFLAEVLARVTTSGVTDARLLTVRK